MEPADKSRLAQHLALTQRVVPNRARPRRARARADMRAMFPQRSRRAVVASTGPAVFIIFALLLIGAVATH